MSRFRAPHPLSRLRVFRRPASARIVIGLLESSTKSVQRRRGSGVELSPDVLVIFHPASPIRFVEEWSLASHRRSAPLNLECGVILQTFHNISLFDCAPPGRLQHGAGLRRRKGKSASFPSVFSWIFRRVKCSSEPGLPTSVRLTRSTTSIFPRNVRRNGTPRRTKLKTCVEHLRNWTRGGKLAPFPT